MGEDAGGAGGEREAERARAEETLHRSEQRFRVLIENALDIITVVDGAWRVLYVSPSIQVLGYSPQEIIGKNGLEFMHPDDLERAGEKLAAIMARPGESVRTEYRFRRKDGSMAYVEAIARNLLHDPGVAAIVVNARDVTQRQRIEAQTEQRARQQAAVAELGLLALTEPELGPLFDQALSRVRATLDVELCAALELAPDRGSLRLRAGAGFPPGVVGAARVGVGLDSQAGYTLLSADPILAVDVTRDARFRAGDLLLDHGAVSGLSVVIQGAAAAPPHPPPDGAGRGELAGAVHADGGAGAYGVLMAHSTRRAWFTQDDAHFLQAIANLLGAKIRELSARDALRRSEEQLRQSQRMEAMGQLAGGIAHDFNNLLTAILSYSEIVQRRLGKESPLFPHVDEIRTAGERAAALTRQILAFSRKQVLHARDLDLNEVIHGLLKLLDRILGEHLEIDFIPGRGLGSVRADPVQMEQVILNLCVNARDAMPEGGRITIETENVLINGEYVRTHPWARSGRYVLLSVSDTGTGIPPEVLEHVFEPFFTTKESGKGTGLGLATVYGVVQQHGGMIHAYSEVGAGTAFKIYLPIVQRQASSVESKIIPGVPRGAETILLAEDDEIVRRLAIRILEGAGYRVLVAGNGEEAVALFEAHAAEIALVLFDVVMPRIGGRVALSRIRARRPDTRFLLCSGYTGLSVEAELPAEEQARWISKPYNPETLLRKVREALDA